MTPDGTDPLTDQMLTDALAAYREREHTASRATTLDPDTLDSRRADFERTVCEVYFATGLDHPQTEWADTRGRAVLMLDGYAVGTHDVRRAVAEQIEDEIISNRLLAACDQVWRRVISQDTGLPETSIPGILGTLYTQDVTCRAWYAVAAAAALDTLGIDPDQYPTITALADAVATGLWWVPGAAVVLLSASPDMRTL